MRAIHSLKALVNRITSRIAAARSRPVFYCGQCELWERCGLPPSANCITMLSQIARNGGRSNKDIAWWRASLGL